MRVEIDHAQSGIPRFKIHEFLTPYIYLLLETGEESDYQIWYSDNVKAIDDLGFYTYVQILDIIFKSTSDNQNSPNLTHCIEWLNYNFQPFSEAISNAKLALDQTSTPPFNLRKQP